MDLSVIIPVYNGETYLDECLASMTRQGFREGVHEVIIVDDGSTDSTAEIALKYCHSFPYFRLIQTANQGVSAARNTGILESKGDYITFMDADDFFADDSYLSLEQIMRKNGLDLVAFKFAENTDELQIIKRNEQYRFYERLSPTSACSAIFKKSILEKHNILFVKEQQLLEDYTFCFKYHYVIQNGCGFFNRRPYYYRNNPDSVSKGIKSQKDPEVRLKKRKNAYNGAFIAISEIQKFAEENGFEEDTSYHGAISACMQKSRLVKRLKSLIVLVFH